MGLEPYEDCAGIFLSVALVYVLLNVEFHTERDRYWCTNKKINLVQKHISCFVLLFNKRSITNVMSDAHKQDVHFYDLLSAKLHAVC